jgi:asparagine N-glycosylation enzyme membrane subunit Stt3
MERLGFNAALKVIRGSFLLQTKERMVQDFFIFTLVFQPILFTILTVGTYLFGGKPSFGMFAIIGAGMMGIWNNNLWSSGEIVNHERSSGTLSLLIASPTPLMLVLLGKSLANAVTSVIAPGNDFCDRRNCLPFDPWHSGSARVLVWIGADSSNSQFE